MRLKQVGTLTPRALGLLAGPAVTALLQCVANSSTRSVVRQEDLKSGKDLRKAFRTLPHLKIATPTSSFAFFHFPHSPTLLWF